MSNILTVKGIRRLLDGMGDNLSETARKLRGNKFSIVGRLRLEGSVEEDSEGNIRFVGKTTPLPDIPVGLEGGYERTRTRSGDGDVLLDYYLKVEGG